ncbi:HSP20-like chaperone [Thozetella sp. PMI_491]|nr:HSP20-like chaperone [Thozetella sp. PMI_491]
MNGFANHPFAQRVREYVENVRAQAMAAARGHQDNGEFGDEDAFVPPVDIFNTDNNWTVHIALPGAKKEDIAVNWDAAKSSLAVSGVVYRPGDEVFLTGMVAGERKVGLFERSIQLPPAGNDDKEEVDGNGITAKLEDGILVVVVPKAEKEWTEVRKVDIL